MTDIEIKCVTGRYNIVDTGQTACYDSISGGPMACSGTGYDADYDGNQPDYTLSGDANMVTDNGDQTISDRATGRMWQKDDYQSVDFAIDRCSWRRGPAQQP